MGATAYTKPRVMPEEVTPDPTPLLIECPRCHAPKGMPCYGAAGQQRTASHLARWKVVRQQHGKRKMAK